MPALRYRLSSLMIAVAFAAVAMRWPAPTLGLAAMLGGPIAGGLRGRTKGDEGMIAGCVAGGAASYAGMALVAALLSLIAGPPVLDPRSLVVAPLWLAFFGAAAGCVGMFVGILVGSVFLVGVAVARRWARRDQGRGGES